MWVQDCYREGIPMDSNMIQEKAKSLCDNWKQKEGGGSKARESLFWEKNATKDIY